MWHLAVFVSSGLPICHYPYQGFFSIPPRHLYPHHTAFLPIDSAAPEPFSHQTVLMVLSVL